MRRHLATLLTLPLLLWASGCVYDLDVEGKDCNTSHICPGGYYCAPVDGGSICKVGSPRDGGDEDAGDRPNCFGDETRNVSPARACETAASITSAPN